jgi:hypothetical protein
LVPYKEITDPAFAVKAAATFTIETYGMGTELLQGPCPRCLAVISIPLFREIVKGGTDEGRLSEDEPTGEPMICTCDEEHADRPADRKGCGAYWNLII